MKKIFLSLILAIVSTVVCNAQLLYKISHKNLEKPSYIVGTYHLAPASFVDSIPGARAALDAVGQVCGEIGMAEMNSPEGTKKVMTAMMVTANSIDSQLWSSNATPVAIASMLVANAKGSIARGAKEADAHWQASSASKDSRNILPPMSTNSAKEIHAVYCSM